MKKPNIISTVISVAGCKFTRFVLRKTGRGGTAIPGIVAMKLCKNILAAVSDGMKIIVVTGTNGKTTTCNMIEHDLTGSGQNCLLNKSGANLLHGIASDLISNATWLGKPKYDYAVLETDEAALKQLVMFVNPKAIVVTNLFSDQVDRYGGVQNTLKEIRTGVERSPRSILVLNADEPLSASLALNVPNKVVWYGFDPSVGVQGNVDLSDAGVCPVCGSEYRYDSHVYAHLGEFACTKCDHKRQDPDITVTAIDKITPEGSSIKVRADGKISNVHVAIPAVYNVYNAAAVLATIKGLKLSLEPAIASLGTARSSFGRLETYNIDGNRLQMILVKNPAGCNQAFTYITGFDEDFTAVLCLNNRTGDGNDISWINDTDYEKLCQDPHIKKIYVCGECAEQLSERLKKAGAGSDLQEIVGDYNTLLEKLKKETYPIFALPNYTSMMELRQVLNAATGNKEFWE